jgi:hypothetical protein
VRTSKIITLASFFLSVILIALGFYLTTINGYGSDNDTYGMIGTYLNILDTGSYNASRFTGNPVAELFIGFTAFYFGSTILKSFIFLFFIAGIILFYLSFEKNLLSSRFSIFLILCLSSNILFFDNLEPMEYSLAFLFFSMGLYFRAHHYRHLMLLCFAFSTGTRISFVLFGILVVALDQNKGIKVKLSELIVLITTSSLFYIPNLIANRLTLDWITAKQPDEQGLLGLIGRFGYKTWIAFGFVSFFLILITLLKKRYEIVGNPSNRLVLILSLANLAIYLWIPADRSYLQPLLIFTYFLISRYANLKTILILLVLNFQIWIVNISLFEFTFRYSGPCDPVYAESIRLSPAIDGPGELSAFITEGDLSRCFTRNFPLNFAESISNGEKLVKESVD